MKDKNNMNELQYKKYLNKLESLNKEFNVDSLNIDKTTEFISNYWGNSSETIANINIKLKIV